jgi:hypothetical protein
MGLVTIASNSSVLENKWVPYYYKPFQLGRVADGDGSTDGRTYITQDASGGAQVAIKGMCDNSLNCGHYYLLHMDDIIGSTYFYIEKYTETHTLVDVIYASNTGAGHNGNWWKLDVTNGSTITIDIGVTVRFPPSSSWHDDDVYKISLPTAEVMEKRKIYHGGYSTYMRMPHAEGVAAHSDVIPTSLKGKNITALLSSNLGYTNPVLNRGHTLAASKEDFSGNYGVSMYLEWNLGANTPTSIQAGSTGDGTAGGYTWGPDERWQLGNVFVDDINPNSATPDGPAMGHSSSTDLIPSTVVGDDYTTGTSQPLNVSVSGRAGYAKIKLEFSTGTGSGVVTAHNQFWPIILLIS